jgi:inosine-uridine nucleoside N-ribohydrolase
MPVSETLQKEKILLDTDIGSDIDDAVCLAYLLMQPRCDLLGLTTVSGEPEKRAMLASAICLAAGRGDVPIFPGAPLPLLTPVRQPLAPQAEKLPGWPHERIFQAGKAIAFLRETIEQNPGEVTLLAIGPMTNAALLLGQDPSIAKKLKRIVLMNGSFLHRLPTAGINEWNSLNDPYAAAVVYGAASPVHRSIGLDVTMQVQLPAKQVYERFTHPVLQPVKDFSRTWFEHTELMTFHDPLAGLSIFEDGVLGFARGQVKVELASDELKGFTHFKRDGSGPHEIAETVNPALFFERFFSVFS